MDETVIMLTFDSHEVATTEVQGSFRDSGYTVQGVEAVREGILRLAEDTDG